MILAEVLKVKKGQQSIQTAWVLNSITVIQNVSREIAFELKKIYIQFLTLILSVSTLVIFKLLFEVMLNNHQLSST